MDRALKLLKVCGHSHILRVSFQSIITNEYCKDMGMDPLYDLYRVCNGKAEGIGVENNRGIVLSEGHLNGKSGMLGNLHVVTFISQNTVKVPDQDRVL